MKIISTKDYQVILKLNKSVHDLHVQLYPEHFKQYDETVIGGFFQSIINNPQFLFLLVEDEGEYRGYAWVEYKDYPESPFTKSRQSIYVHHLNILESHKGKGYGSHLMNAIYEIARKNGRTKVELDYWVGNGAAEKFYEKEGFQSYREYVFKDLAMLKANVDFLKV
ncbi:GNAT family N-acetyltransferase [Evansella tamaricis]|uniref:GNAT family N-acetyltransferase n=1 Tax=Evansella tamaricis TaxID=2069301 RepID=UPI001FEA6DAE|nr:GNAT family N-acetyltransferase [Evansella tamaricis]